ncbi:MAG: DUF6622 family protein [Dokdonella sp.]
MILEILTHTPTWVFVLFAVIVSMGVKRLSDGERDVRRVCLVPILFIVFGVLRLSQHDDAMATSAWLIAAAAGTVVGCMVRPTMCVAAGRHRIFLAGSAWPLARIVVIFVAHYFLNVAAVLSFDHRVDFMRLDATVSGMAAGFFAGWLWRFVQAYRVAKAIPAIGVGTNAVV